MLVSSKRSVETVQEFFNDEPLVLQAVVHMVRFAGQFKLDIAQPEKEALTWTITKSEKFIRETRNRMVKVTFFDHFGWRCKLHPLMEIRRGNRIFSPMSNYRQPIQTFPLLEVASSDPNLEVNEKMFLERLAKSWAVAEALRHDPKELR